MTTALAAAALALPACAGEGPVALSVSAASSLTDAVKEVNSRYVGANPSVTVTSNFAASGTLQTQIENGAPVDVFLSAGAAQMDNLQQKGLLLDGTRRDLLNNTLVLIVPAGSTLGLKGFGDLAADSVKRVALGDPKSVPAGSYGQQALDALGLTARVQAKLVLAGDARQVLAYVASGNVDAGLVFATDALTSARVKVVAAGPAEVNARIVYPVVVIKSSKVPAAARDYVDFLFTATARGVFEKYGFKLAGK